MKNKLQLTNLRHTIGLLTALLSLLFVSQVAFAGCEGGNPALKHPWAGSSWSWKALTLDSGTKYYLYADYGNNGCNINNVDGTVCNGWNGNPTLVGSPSKGSYCKFEYDDSNGAITITKQDFALVGTFNSWNYGANSLASGSTVVHLTKGSHEFKVQIGNIYYSCQQSGCGTIVRSNCSGWILYDNNSGNTVMTADVEGDYTFTWSSSNQKISVTYPTKYTAKAQVGSVAGGTVTLDSETASSSSVSKDVASGTSVIFKAIANSGYTFKGWGTTSSATSYVSTEANYTVSITSNKTLYAIFASACTPPTAYAVSGTATICSGSSTNVTVANSQTGYTYKLYKGGTATSTTKTGTTGSALNFSVSAAGTYTVKGYQTGSESCSTDMTGSAVITVNQKPTAYTVSGTATICSGSSTNVTVANSQTGYTYKLYKGGTATSTTKTGTGSALTFNVSEAGAYTVKGYFTGSESCSTDMSGTATVTVYTNPAAGFAISAGSTTPEITTNSGTTTTTLTSSASNVSSAPYKEWYCTNVPSTGAPTFSSASTLTPTVTFHKEGTFKFKLKAGCSSTNYVESAELTVTVSGKLYIKGPVHDNDNCWPGYNNTAWVSSDGVYTNTFTAYKECQWGPSEFVLSRATNDGDDKRLNNAGVTMNFDPDAANCNWEMSTREGNTTNYRVKESFYNAGEQLTITVTHIEDKTFKMKVTKACTTPSTPEIESFNYASCTSAYVKVKNSTVSSSNSMLLVRYVGSSPTITNPTNGQTYSVGATLGDGTVVYAGEKAAEVKDEGLTNVYTNYTYALYQYTPSPCYYYSAAATKTTVMVTPAVTTADATNISAGTATLGGSFSARGRGGATLEYGVIWTETIGGKTKDQKEVIGTTNIDPGSFSKAISFDGGATYKYKAYVKTNSDTGCEYGYGTEKSVTVPAACIPPAAPTTQGATVCSGNDATLSVTSSTTGLTIKWYSAATGGTLLETGTSYTMIELQSTQTVYAEASATEGCASSRTATTATVTPLMALTSITASATPICINGTSDITANGLVLGGGSIAYSSSSTAAATVAASGNNAVVTGKNAGTTTITATVSGGCKAAGDPDPTATVDITVNANMALESISLSKSSECIGGTVTITPNGYVPGGSAGKITYSSTNTDVATVSGATITVVGAGSTTIKANVTSGCGSSVEQTEAFTGAGVTINDPSPSAPHEYEPTEFTSSASADSWSVTPGSVEAYLSTKSAGSSTVLKAKAGSYTVTASKGTCSSTKAVTVKEWPDKCD